MCCTVASILYIMLRLQLLIRCHWSLKRNFILKLLKKLLSEDLTPLKFLSVFSSYCYIFLFFTLKFQIGKKLFLKFGIYFTEITGRNFCDLTLFFRNLWKFIPTNYLIFDHSRMFFLAETHSEDTISESHLPAFG